MDVKRNAGNEYFGGTDDLGDAFGPSFPTHAEKSQLCAVGMMTLAPSLAPACVFMHEGVVEEILWPLFCLPTLILITT